MSQRAISTGRLANPRTPAIAFEHRRWPCVVPADYDRVVHVVENESPTDPDCIRGAHWCRELGGHQSMGIEASSTISHALKSSLQLVKRP